MKRLLFVTLLLFASGPSVAGSIDQLRAFMDGVKTLRANFTQTVSDRAGKVTNESAGVMQFSRPGRFRWEYSKPYPQVIVGDGQKLWIYDVDLNQVTVKTLSESLGSTPAALLAGSNEIEKSFTLVDSGSNNGVDWLQAVPKDRDSTFESIRMGFTEAGLSVMELIDNFGQRTVIRFAKLDRNSKLPADMFKFTPPKGVDVVGE